MLANKYTIRTGIGVAKENLSSFDKALINAGIANYNLVRLSSILPAHCKFKNDIDLKEGSLLPTAYATITSSKEGERIASAIGIGFSYDTSKVGVIMEYSACNATKAECEEVVRSMICEAFQERGWELMRTVTVGSEAIVGKEEVVSTFACVSEWW